MRKVGGGRNFGWGKQMEWAGKQALRAAFGGGHYGTVASHTARWRKFCQWAREQGVRDARDVSRSALAQFTEHLSQQTASGMSNGYAKNMLTSVNAVLCHGAVVVPGQCVSCAGYLRAGNGVRSGAAGCVACHSESVDVFGCDPVA